MTFERITVDPARMGGQPCLRGLRIPVATVVAMVEDGMSVGEVIAALPDLEPDDVDEALRFAAETGRQRRRHTSHRSVREVLAEDRGQ